MLPTNTREMAEIARGYNEKLKSRAWTKADANRRVRHSVEIRHPSFCDERFMKLCRRHKIAVVFADTAGRWPYVEDVTADFVYIRLHGDEELYVSGYTDRALDWWAARIDKWRTGCEPDDPKRVGGAGKKCKKS
jgi:uncharacterized protein YecE (DUF72 family)